MRKSLASGVAVAALSLACVAVASAVAAQELPCTPEAALRLEARGISVPIACPEHGGDAWPDWTHVFPAGETRLETALAALNRELSAAGLPGVSLADATVRGTTPGPPTRRAERAPAAPRM